MTNHDDAGCSRCASLERRLAALEAENRQLRDRLQPPAPPPPPLPSPSLSSAGFPDEAFKPAAPQPTAAPTSEGVSALSRREMERYGRQMLVSDFGAARQLALRRARVLIVGAGGLGCPAGLWLAGMGVGRLGLVDDDRVERSNLHRQIAHGEAALGERKVTSLARRLRDLNPDITVDEHPTRLTATNALALVGAYDVVVDASDNPPTRYLVNAACARLGRRLVSGSALGLEGQVTVFTYRDDAACYQCLYPTPPRAPQSCADHGVLGVVPGIIGAVQALETVKVLTQLGSSSTAHTQLFFDAYDSSFRRLQIQRRRQPTCGACGANATPSDAVNAVDGPSGRWCPGVPRASTTTCALSEPDDNRALAPEHQISVHELAEWRARGRATDRDYVLLDTRAPHQFDIVHFPEAVNVPFDLLERERQHGPQRVVEAIQGHLAEAAGPIDVADCRLAVICRRGVDSVTVTRWLVDAGLRGVANVEGGYTRYADATRGVDPAFPMY